MWALPLIASVATGAYDWWVGNKQSNRADQLAKDNVRPTFEIPTSEQESLESARKQAEMTRLPGQSAIEGRLDRTTADQVAMVERTGVGGPTSINAASRAYGMQQDKENELGIAAAQMRLKNQDILRGELDENAEWQNKAWNWDTGEPYLQKQQAIAALKEAGMRNKNTAFKNIIGGASYAGLLGMSGEGGGDFFGSGGNGNYSQDGTSGDGFNFTDPRFSDPNSPLFKTQYNIKTPEQLSYTDKMLSGWNWGGNH